MADFRKLLFVLIAGALLFTTVASAAPFTCSITPTQTIVRQEGLADYVGDVILNCYGEVTDPTVGIQNVNIRLTMNNGVNITSNILNTTTLITEASMIMNEGITAGGRVWYGYGSGAPDGAQNVYQAVKVADNAVEWQNVTIAAPGSNPFTTIRLTNVRVNATGMPAGTAISGYINIISPTSIPIYGTANVVVANVLKGMTFSVISGSWSQCVLPVGESVGHFHLLFTEGYAAAFKKQGSSMLDNFVPGGNYPNESGWAPGPGTAAGGLFGTLDGYSGYAAGPPIVSASSTIGQANNPTKLLARITAIPLGVSALTLGTVSSEGITVSVAISAISGTGVNRGATVTATVTGTTGVSITDPEVVNIQINMTLDYTVPAPIGTIVANGTYTPISTVGVMSAIDPEPRFVDTGTPNNDAFAFNGVCRTLLFFPYLTNVTTSWDTGIAIINSSKDALGTAPQSGTCTLNYYGSVAAGTLAVPALQPPLGSGVAVTPSIPAGGQFIVSLSEGVGRVWPADAPFFTTAYTPPTASTCAVCGPIGFQGYMIASCNFQFAHGYAFISDNGAQKLAHGYLALVIPDRKSPAVVTRLPQNAGLGAVGNEGEQLGY